MTAIQFYPLFLADVRHATRAARRFPDDHLRLALAARSEGEICFLLSLNNLAECEGYTSNSIQQGAGCFAVFYILYSLGGWFDEEVARTPQKNSLNNNNVYF